MSFFVVGAAIYTAYSTNKSADKANKTAKDSAAASLAFDQQKYDDWKATYGGIEDNLSKYYNSLTPSKVAAEGVTEYNKQQSIALDNVKTNLAQRGMLDSGINTAIELTSELQGARDRANIRSTADDVVAAQQSSFLSLGLGNDPSVAMSANLANQATNAQRSSVYADQVAGKAIGSAITNVGSAIADYQRSKKKEETT